MAPRLPDLYARMAAWPGGRWLFARLVCLKAPYFGSIAPRLDELVPGRAVASLRHRRRVRNHIGTVHAIALCNLAEFAGGLATEATVPAGMRWIPKRMQVDYLAKASGTMRATATVPEMAVRDSGYTAPVEVVVHDPAGVAVFTATIEMWISPRAPA
ncbi:DUF4442 domain-containing protein [Luteimonas yindakuii]|uniref:DUF4442 domain-containing protein n=1 Tax=Luteimonas yindakuii TaxID=2565782 RepID=A0A4Z1RFC9_9GAMM|nr:hotdog fold domain-containing protein [Luteimonas yindakuii]QCU72431.1 DUF4442 domain-containing protein [Luteimonas yindakuii]TKS53377.1 DUF4442 domain-containing protein [Luteimonas yindakuii]